MKDNTIYVLARKNDEVIGVFTTRRMLHSGVNHWSSINPDSCIYFQAFMKNYIPGKLGKKCWAYIPKYSFSPNNNIRNIQTGVNLVGKPEDDVEV